MHKRNIFIAALLTALLITMAFWLFPALSHSSLLAWVYVPVLVADALSAYLSGHSHSPSAIAGWVSFIAYTVLYWGIFMVVYAVLLELNLIRGALHSLEVIHRGPERSREAVCGSLKHIGTAVATIETRRRKHWFLRNFDSIDLSDDAAQVGAHAITHLGHERVVKSVLKRLKTHLANEVGASEAAQFIADLKDEARTRSDGAGAAGV